MAYDQHYRPASQNSMSGLCSSQSYLDGVPFKISSAFRPSAQPAVPPHLLRPCQPCEAFHTEYAYDTEEAVLAWSRAREEAKAIAEREAGERRKAALAAAESRSSESEEDGEGDADASTQARQEAHTSQPQAQPVKPPWQLPVAASLTNTILTPTPSQSFQKKVQSPLAPQNPVDLALFEQEDDPFDNMELQTLNDMEELRTLLGGGSQGPSPNPDSQVISSVSDQPIVGDGQTVNAQCEATHQVNGQSTKSSPTNIFTSIPGVKMFQKTPPDSVSSWASQTNGKNKSARPNSPAAGPSTEATTEEDYVHIRSDYSQQAVHFQKDSAPNGKLTSENVASGGGGELTHQDTNGKVCKTVLPPIRSRGKSLSGEGIDGTGSGGVSSSISSEAQPVPQPRHSFQGGGMSQSAYVMSSSSSCKEPSLSDFFSNYGLPAHTSLSGPHSRPAGGGASTAFGHNPYSRHSNMGCDSPTQVNGVRGDRGGLRSAKSNPDLLERNTSPFEGGFHSSAQPWNPYTPLPPTPVPSLGPDSCSPEALEQGHSPSPPPPAAAAAVSSTTRDAGSTPNQADYDPYPSLSSQAKTFVTNLTSMGFSRSRVSRAVEKFGTDEREVLDHLLNVDKLVEKRFTPALAETSLQLFRNNIHQAEQFLNLHRQFSELGFSEDRIKTALVKNQLDRDRALDDLTT